MRATQAIAVLWLFLAQAQQDDAGYVAQEQKRAERHKTALEAAPEDPEANFGWGSFLCLVKADWESGLPFLSKGGERKAAEAARKDLACDPKDPAAAAACGDAWWALAKGEKGARQRSVYARGARWYRLALPGCGKDLAKAILPRLDQHYRSLGQVKVALPSTDQWVDTGVDVVAGLSVRVAADGAWSWDGTPDKAAWCDWRGYPRGFSPLTPLPTAQSMCLLARVDGGRVWAPYKDSPMVADVSGRLRLGCNDFSLGDNKGSLAVTMELWFQR